MKYFGKRNFMTKWLSRLNFTSLMKLLNLHSNLKMTKANNSISKLLNDSILLQTKVFDWEVERGF